MKKILLSATALVALSATAFAADLPSRAHAPSLSAPPVFTWTGFYVGGSVGVMRATHAVNDPNEMIAYSYERSSDGGLFGVNAGYNWQTGALVLGLEADIAAATNSNSWNPYNYTDGTYQTSNKIDSLGTVRARVGYAVDRALFYVTGGLAYGQVKNYLSGYVLTAPVWSGSSWQTGWTVGGGVEYALTNNWTVRAEALYVDLGKKTVQALDPSSCSAVSFKNTDLVGRVGVNYKF